MKKHSVSPTVTMLTYRPRLIDLGHGFHRDIRKLTKWKDTLVYCISDVPPTRLEATVTKLCTITSDLTHLKKKAFASHRRIFKRYYTAHYMLCLGVHNKNLTFKLDFEGRHYGVANVDFD